MNAKAYALIGGLVATLPIKRRRRRRMILFCVVCVGLLVSGCLCVFLALNDAEEPPVPEAAPEPVFPPQPVEVWARYDVPLDDDLQRYIVEMCRAYEVPASVVMAVI